MDEQLNIEKFSNIELDQDSVKSISKQCNDLKSLQKQIEDKEKEISELKVKAKNYEEKIIPDMLQEAGVDKIQLSDGTVVEVKPFYAARIPESRNEEAFSWLRDKGFGDLIKNTVTTTFNRGQDNQVAELVRVCEQHGFKYLQKQKVEPMTLKAFAREQVEKGKELPFDLFGIYIANKAKLKTKE